MLLCMFFAGCKIDNSAIFKNANHDSVKYEYRGLLGSTDLSWDEMKKEGDTLTIKNVKASKTFPWKSYVRVEGNFNFHADPKSGLSPEESAAKSEFADFFLKN